ncbi:hypothetical protein LUZ61_021004 [Rhynchospora tenuis]|uniref:Reverse transcriptase domain-containing protein n=1 Tax=Rhynchospora tenuis TaxID=198213 RepID=A0AAD5ZE21_9POAL|nr:hypothetical protein LUZ61_021004 [Rhynchospora tenuis]
MGDFNVLRWTNERSTTCLDFTAMEMFNNFIDEAALLDAPIVNKPWGVARRDSNSILLPSRQNRLRTWLEARVTKDAASVEEAAFYIHLRHLGSKLRHQVGQILPKDHFPSLKSCQNIISRRTARPEQRVHSVRALTRREMPTSALLGSIGGALGSSKGPFGPSAQRKVVAVALYHAKSKQRSTRVEQQVDQSEWRLDRGSDVATESFNPAALYNDTTIHLSSLCHPFIEPEIKHAVMSLSNDKSSGPDGVPNEFYKLNWELVKGDLLAVFNSLFEGTLNLDSSNHARIVLIAKEDHPTSLAAFRPISIISYIPKLISKVLANRLAAFMPMLIANSQTGFIKGRLIAENFTVARELVTTLNNQLEPAFLLKLDFRKAFDSVSWPFLFAILTQRGFPQLFISWIKLLFYTATSSIAINDLIGPSFSHKRGLRQGDPLSPFLYLLAADVLTRMLHAASLSVPHSICQKLTEPFILLQYADDTLLFSTAKGTSVHVLRQVLNTFSGASEIQINLSKSSLVPFNLSEQMLHAINPALQVQSHKLPLTYLGLPLTLNRPDKVAYQGILDKLQCRLAGWKSSLLSRAVRVTLASSVLSSIPIFFMSVFKLPAWVVKATDRIRRNFIWGSATANHRAIHLLSWDRICLPKSHGGFGLINLKLQNIALLLKWWWRLHNNPQSLLSDLARRLYSKRDPAVPPIAWNSTGSFFWRDLFSIRIYFQLSSTSIVGSGANTSFWYSNWGGSCLSFCGHSEFPLTRRFISLKQALPICHQLLPGPLTFQQQSLMEVAANFFLNEQPDSLSWKWTPHGQFTASSAYFWLISAGKTRFPLKFLWKLKLPPSIKFFLLLLAHGRILTQDQLLKRNIQVTQGCLLCHQITCETAAHLFFDCPFSTQLWLSLGVTAAPALQFSDLPLIERLLILFNSVDKQSRTITIIATTLWAIWLERNNRTFRHKSRPLDAIHQWIICEATLFIKHC